MAVCGSVCVLDILVPVFCHGGIVTAVASGNSEGWDVWKLIGDIEASVFPLGGGVRGVVKWCPSSVKVDTHTQACLHTHTHTQTNG